MQIKLTYLQVILIGLIVVLLGVSFNLVRKNRALETSSGRSTKILSTQTQPSAEAVEIRVTARQWRFDPDPIRVKLGQRVRLIVKSEDVAHGLAIPEFGINEVLAPGKESVIEFLADKQGTFDFFCSVACGEGHAGMRGSLIVE